MRYKTPLCLLFVVCVFSIVFRTSSYAAISCKLTTSPSPVTSDVKQVDYTITTTGLVEGKKYDVYFNNVRYCDAAFQDCLPIPGTAGFPGYEVKNGTITLRGHYNPPGYREGYGTPFVKDTYKAGDYTISVRGSDGATLCSQPLKVEQANSGGTDCSIVFLNPTFTNADTVTIQVIDQTGQDGDGRRVIVKKNDQNGAEVINMGLRKRELSKGKALQQFESGVYLVEITNAMSGINESRICYSTFTITAPGETGGGVGTGGGKEPPTPPPPCTEKQRDSNGVCKEINTALGPIQTDPVSFIKSLMGVILGLAGGIALLLIIYSGYKLMTSQGNPETIQGARETLTSAIVGLLFIIFSMVILQIIGAGILGIPGFK